MCSRRHSRAGNTHIHTLHTILTMHTHVAGWRLLAGTAHTVSAVSWAPQLPPPQQQQEDVQQQRPTSKQPL